jgi:hypothetical protein
MATLEQTRVLSDPSVYVDDRNIAVLPNTVGEREPGQVTVRSISAGGGAVRHVSGSNVESLKGMVKFSLATTGENIALIEDWRARSNAGISIPMMVISPTRQSTYDAMWMTEEVEIEYEGEAAVELVFEGSLPRRA